MEVLDVNEHEPIFTHQDIHLTVPEDYKVGTSLSRIPVHATDNDHQNLPAKRKGQVCNSVITYFLICTNQAIMTALH